MNIIDNWYSLPEAIDLYSSYRNREIVEVIPNTKNTNSKIYFLKYLSNNTVNLLPINSYCSLELLSDPLIFIKEITSKLEKLNVTTTFIPIMTTIDPSDILSVSSYNIYKKRNRSYILDLSKPLEFIKKNISSRKQTFLNKSLDNSRFFVADLKERKLFPDMFISFMKQVGSSKSSIFSIEYINKIIFSPNVLILGIKIDDKIELMHLIGLSKDKLTADFVFAASTIKGYKAGTMLVWEEIKFLKSKNVRRFHLGGGINEGDGIDEFKRQMGGQLMYNGGFKLIINDKLYNQELIHSMNNFDDQSFFPIYLKNQVLLNTK